jgi:hypothetical protein
MEYWQSEILVLHRQGREKVFKWHDYFEFPNWDEEDNDQLEIL